MPTTSNYFAKEELAGQTGESLYTSGFCLSKTGKRLTGRDGDEVFIIKDESLIEEFKAYEKELEKEKLEKGKEEINDVQENRKIFLTLGSEERQAWITLGKAGYIPGVDVEWLSTLEKK